MAGDAIVGALRVVLGMDTAAYEDGAKKASGATKDFVKAMTEVAAGIQLQKIVDKLVDSFVANSVAAFNLSLELGRLSQRTGVSIEQLSAFKLAADLNQMSMQDFGNSLVKLGKAITDAVGKPMSDAARAFRAFGLDAAQLNKMNLADAFLATSDAVAKFGDSTTKTKGVTMIFGDSAERLIPLLNKGSIGLKELTDEAEKLGLVLDKDTVKSAERLNATLIRLNATKDAFFTQLTSSMLPSLEELSNVLLNTSKNTGLLSTAAEKVGGFFANMTKAALVAVGGMQAVGTVWSALVELLKAGGGTEAMDKFKQKVAEAAVEQYKLFQGFSDASFAQKFNAGIQQMLDDLDKLGASTKKNLDPKKLAPPNAFDQYLNGIKKTTAATEAQTQTVGMLNSAQERLRISMEADAVAKANNIVLTDKQKQAASDAGYAAGLAKDQLEGMNLVFANKTPLEQYTLQLDLLTQKMTLAGAKTEEIARAQKKLAEQFGLTWEQIGASIGTTFGAVSQIFGQYAKENKTLGIASKVFGLAQVAINTAIAISKANTLLPPANFAAMAAAAAVGVAQAATIAAQQFATGGSFKVGGVGGIDSQLVTFAATPGEMVDVRKPGATGASAEITVNGIGPRDFFTGDMLRAMVEGLNAAHGDGYKLKFAG